MTTRQRNGMRVHCLHMGRLLCGATLTEGQWLLRLQAFVKSADAGGNYCQACMIKALRLIAPGQKKM